MNKPKTIKFRNPSVREIIKAIEQMQTEKEKFDILFNKFTENYTPSLEDAILSEHVKFAKKVAKKYQIPYAELHQLYIEKQTSERSPEEVKNAVSLTEEEVDERLTVTAEEVTLKLKPQKPSDKVCEQVTINAKPYFADVVNNCLLDENLTRVGSIVTTEQEKGKPLYEYILD